MKYIFFSFLLLSNLAIAKGGITELDRIKNENLDVATLSYFTLGDKETTVINVSFSGLKCMKQPIIIEGHQDSVGIKWKDKTALHISLGEDLKYKDNTQGGYINCKDYKLKVDVIK